MKHLSVTGKVITVFFLLLNIFVVAAGKINPDFGATLLEEDRFVENMTALALAAASLYILVRSLRNLGAANYLKGAVQLLIVLALIFMAGEEISWGQRIFHWQTTGLFKQDNLQNETNFHNLKVGEVKLNKIIFTYAFFAIGVFVFVLSPFLYKRFAGFRNFFNKFGATLPSYNQTALLLFGLLFTIVITNSRKWELWECNAAIVILWLILEPINAKEIYARRRTDISAII